MCVLEFSGTQCTDAIRRRSPAASFRKKDTDTRHSP